MDEYIKREDALKIIDNYSKAVTEEGMVVVDAIRDIVAIITPTADVVPKSELEIWKQDRFNLYQRLGCYEMARQKVEGLEIELEAMRGAANSYKMHYENLVREIFEEIEKIIDEKYNRFVFKSQPFDADEEIEAIINYSDCISDGIAELKKKYIPKGE